MIGTFYREKWDLQLRVPRNWCGTGALCGDREVNLVDASGCEEAGGKEQDGQVMVRPQHHVSAPSVTVLVSPELGRAYQDRE